MLDCIPDKDNIELCILVYMVTLVGLHLRRDIVAW